MNKELKEELIKLVQTFDENNVLNFMIVPINDKDCVISLPGENDDEGIEYMTQVLTAAFKNDEVIQRMLSEVVLNVCIEHPEFKNDFVQMLYVRSTLNN